MHKLNRYFKKKIKSFKTIHTDLPDMLSYKANLYKIDKFIHLSSLGIENANDSKYAAANLRAKKYLKILKIQ